MPKAKADARQLGSDAIKTDHPAGVLVMVSKVWSSLFKGGYEIQK